MNTKNAYAGKTIRKQIAVATPAANRTRALSSLLVGVLLLILLVMTLFSYATVEGAWIHVAEVMFSAMSAACFFVAHRFNNNDREGKA